MKGLKKFDHNPFVKELNGVMYIQPRANIILSEGEAIVDVDTGEISKERKLIGRQKMVDKSDFTKIYAKSIGTIMEFSPNTVKVLMYLLAKVDYENKVIFSYNKDFAKLGYKSPISVYKGMCELLKHKIIALHDITNIWWVNPLFVCKGERFATYTEYVKGKGGTSMDAVENILKKPLEKGEDPTKRMRTFDSKNRQITIDEAIEAKEKEA